MGNEKMMVWYGMVWYGMVWYGMVWYGMVWYGMWDRQQSRACVNSVCAAISARDASTFSLEHCCLKVLELHEIAEELKSC